MMDTEREERGIGVGSEVKRRVGGGHREWVWMDAIIGLVIWRGQVHLRRGRGFELTWGEGMVIFVEPPLLHVYRL